MDIDAVKRTDLKVAFGWVRETGAVAPSDLAELMVVRSSYTRELMAALGRANLGQWDGFEYTSDHWDTDEEAHAAFDQAFTRSGGRGLDVESTNSVKFSLSGQKAPDTRQEDEMTATETTTLANTLNRCGCGCGREIGKRSIFAQGHDAKMVSNAAQDLVYGAFGGDYLGWLADAGLHPSADIQERMDKVAAGISKSFSSALATKYVGAAHTEWVKWTARTDKAENKLTRAEKKAAKKAPVESWSASSPVKVGRWEYPTRTNGAGTVTERNTKRDGSGEWVAV